MFFLYLIYVVIAMQALKAIKTSEFMPFVVFVSAPPGDMLRNMHEFAYQRGITDKIRTVGLATFIILVICWRCWNMQYSRTSFYCHLGNTATSLLRSSWDSPKLFP